MIVETLKKEQIECMKAKDEKRLSIIRYLLAEIKYKEIELRNSGTELTDELVLRVLKSQLKRRTKNLELFEKSGREDLIAKEKEELELVTGYFDRFSKELGIDLSSNVPEQYRNNQK